jgi:hypothetical protein
MNLVLTRSHYESFLEAVGRADIINRALSRCAPNSQASVLAAGFADDAAVTLIDSSDVQRALCDIEAGGDGC